VHNSVYFNDGLRDSHWNVSPKLSIKMFATKFQVINVLSVMFTTVHIIPNESVHFKCPSLLIILSFGEDTLYIEGCSNWLVQFARTSRHECRKALSQTRHTQDGNCCRRGRQIGRGYDEQFQTHQQHPQRIVSNAAEVWATGCGILVDFDPTLHSQIGLHT
ncbi:hypothetical protein IscW_ISCW008164, partial [Ixodes scapularis]